MVQRSDQHTRDTEFDVDDLTESAPGEDASTGGSGGRLSRVFDPKTFLLALLLVVAGLLVGGAVVPFVDALGGLLGVFAAGFALGASKKRRSYVEVGLAGAAAAGVVFAVGHLAWIAFGVGVPLAALGAGSGLLAAVAGHYFGRDLRDGLTQSI